MPKVNGKEYPYTAAGMKAAENAKKKQKPKQGGSVGKPKPQKPGVRILPGKGYTTPNERMPDLQKPGGIRDKSVSPVKPKKKMDSKISGTATSRIKPSASMTKALPGNKGGINLGSAAKKFIMTMPPVGAAVTAAKAGMATGRAINNAINPPSRKMMPGTRPNIGEPARPRGGTPLPKQVPTTPRRRGGVITPKPMPAGPRKKTLLPKKMGR